MVVCSVEDYISIELSSLLLQFLFKIYVLNALHSHTYSIYKIIYKNLIKVIFCIGWWRGQSGNVAGWFPSNYTQEEGDADDTLHTYAMAENVLDIVVALYSFTSTNDQELSFEKGDRLEILDRPPSDPEW